MYKVFINDKVIFLADSLNLHKVSPGIRCLKFESEKTISEALTFLHNLEGNEVAIIDENIDVLYRSFLAKFKYIEAAGGAVINEKKELLFIFRLGKWDLPKGKVEKEEDIRDAAIREVEEECGINGLEIIKELSPTFHIYEHKGKMVLKKTYWFEMQTQSENQILIPQTEEGITEVKWMNFNESKKAIENTYGTIKTVVEEVFSNGL